MRARLIVLASWVLASSLLYGQTPPSFALDIAPDPSCLAPLGTHAPAIFLTGLKPTTSAPGLPGLLSYGASAPDPIQAISVLIDGAAVPPVQIGTNLAAFGSIWFTIPGPGVHTVGLMVQTSYGCSLTRTWPLPLTVAAPQPVLSALPLLHKASLVYQGAFRVPAVLAGTHGAYLDGFDYAGTGLAFSQGTNSLFMTGHNGEQKIAEFDVPATLGTGAIETLPRAILRQDFADVLEGRLLSVRAPGDSNPALIGGFMPIGSALFVSGFAYYDGGGGQVRSIFRSGLNLATQGDVLGPLAIGAPRAGYVSGWMGLVPKAWQAAFGGDLLLGQCCIPIIFRTSYGPAAFTVDSTKVGAVDPVPASALVYYPSDHPLGEYNGTSALFNGATEITGVVFPDGSRSVLFFGRHGTGPSCYGIGTADASLQGQPIGPDIYCFDPQNIEKGPHSYPYRYQVWMYDALDLKAVKDETKEPWALVPEVWQFDLPIPAGAVHLHGAAYDPFTGRIFLSQDRADDKMPVIHVFTINLKG